MRISLNGQWDFLSDPLNEGIQKKWYLPQWISIHKENFTKIQVPSNYNAQFPHLFQYSGVVWYYKEIQKDSLKNHLNQKAHYFINFAGVNYYTTVWIDGIEIGEHEGGFTPFSIPFSSKLFQGSDSSWLIVRVDNAIRADRIPGESTDWFNWGGIHRDVSLKVLPLSYLTKTKIIPQFSSPYPKRVRIKVSSTITHFQDYIKLILIENMAPLIHYECYSLETNGKDVDGRKQFKKTLIIKNDFVINPEKKSEIDSPLKNPGNTPHFRSYVSQKYIQEEMQIFFYFSVDKPYLWTPSSPNLYEICLRLHPFEELIKIRFGIRSITTKGVQIFLNYVPIYLHGASLHEEQVPYGRHYPIANHISELHHMKSLGFNALRSAHYSHDELLCELCDEEGLLLLEEIPVYWNIQYSNRHILKLAMKMMNELIMRDINHPSVILWSIGNEMPVENKDCRQYIRLLLEYTKKLDPSRLTSFVSCRMTTDLIRRRGDVNLINFYFGWYYLSSQNLNLFLDAMYWSTHPNSPWIMTDFGAGAKRGTHGFPIKYSEENQAMIVAHQIAILNSKPYIAGWFIWIYRDFRSSQRLNEYQQGFNRKGIVDEFNEPKLIVKYLKRLNQSKIREICQYPLIGAILGHFLRPLEFFAVKLIFYFEYRKERKLVQNYYHKQSTKK